MSAVDRYELKFIVSADQRARFLELSRRLLVVDPHGPGGGYRVSSQYFDTPDHRGWREKLDGVSNRRKLRLRYYGEVDGEASFPARAFFLEIKHRASETIRKERLRLEPAAARAILDDAGELLRIGSHAAATAPDDGALASMLHLAAGRRLVAANVITYHREAWAGAVDSRLRITFDSSLRALPPDRFLAVSDRVGERLLPPTRLLLEVKFDTAIPVWVKDVLRVIGLRPGRFSKYATGMEALRVARARGLVARPEAPNAPVGEEVARTPETPPAVRRKKLRLRPPRPAPSEPPARR